MNEVNWELIIFIIIVGLIVFAGFGIFIGTRISADKRRIRELEGELSAARKDLETYRTRVNDHFKKTSELFTRLTDSYKAVYVHLAEGAQSLCTGDAALLKPADSEFLKLAHGEGAREAEVEDTVRRQAVKEPEAPAGPEGQPEMKTTGPAAVRPEPVRPEREASAPEQAGPSEPIAEEQPDTAGKKEARPKEEQKNTESQTHQANASQ